MKENHINENNLRHLIDTFYEKIRHDNLLGPVFLKAIDQNNWKEHLATMSDFWSAIMLGTRRYYGNPILKHKALPSLNSSLFDRWLVLFEETASKIYTQDIAALYVDKSQHIAENLKRKLGIYENHL